jgi:predicted membrane-bound mannosyltransferase
MLLVFFTALLLGAGWRYLKWRALNGAEGRATLSSARRDEANQCGGARCGEDTAPCLENSVLVEGRGRRAALWAALVGAALGLMWATKETFVLTLAAMSIAFAGTIVLTFGTANAFRVFRAAWNWKHIALAIAAMALMWLLFFSSFFTNFRGLADSVITYLPWLKRAGGHSPHVHPWYFYLERLAWFHPRKSPVWSEGFVLVLALIGFITAFLRGAPLPRFIAIYTVVLTAIYSVISYKTPWCLLNFYLGFLLLAGIGAAALVDLCRLRVLKILVALLLLVPAGQLAWQAWRASVPFAADRRNPYVYAQTLSSLIDLVERAEGIARVAPTGFDSVIKVVVPENDYWPLPWYLRRFKNVGWYDRVPDDPFAPIIILDSKLDARLDDKSNRKWIMAGLTELRPGVFLELYVELELWKKFVETLPRNIDE